MSQAVSNLSFFVPVSSRGAASNGAKSLCFWGPSNSVKPASGGSERYRKNNNVVAMAAGEAGDNLDHLQRANNYRQAQPKKRVAPAAPVGNQLQNPSLTSVKFLIKFTSL